MEARNMNLNEFRCSKGTHTLNYTIAFSFDGLMASEVNPTTVNVLTDIRNEDDILAYVELRLRWIVPVVDDRTL